MDPSRPPLGVFGVLREALRVLITRNWKLMLPLILLVLVPNSLLSLLENLLISPPLANNASKPVAETLKRLLHFRLGDDETILNAVDSLIIPVAFYLLKLFWTIAAIYGAAVTYSGDRLSLGELFFRIKRNWKDPVTAQIYITLLGAGYFHFCDALMDILMTALEDYEGPAILMMAFTLSFSFLTNLLFVYLSVAWTVGLVISVVEESSGGLRALGMGGEAIRGRRLKGFGIGIFSLVFLKFILDAIESALASQPVTASSAIVISLVLANCNWLLLVFNLVAYTVFYYECKREEMIYRRLPDCPCEDGALA